MFNNGRTPGGRMSSKQHQNGKIDYGAPCLSVTDPAFKVVVSAWQQKGLVKPWNATEANWSDSKLEALPNLEEHYIGVSGIDAIPAHLAKGIKIYNAQGKSIEHTQEGWYVTALPYKADEKVFGPYDFLVFAMAAPQSLRIIPDLETPFLNQLNKIKMTTTMIAIITVNINQDHLPTILYFPDKYEIDKMIRHTNGAGKQTTTWVAHASAWWSIPRYEQDRNKVGLDL